MRPNAALSSCAAGIGRIVTVSWGPKAPSSGGPFGSLAEVATGSNLFPFGVHRRHPHKNRKKSSDVILSFWAPSSSGPATEVVVWTFASLPDVSTIRLAHRRHGRCGPVRFGPTCRSAMEAICASPGPTGPVGKPHTVAAAFRRRSAFGSGLGVHSELETSET